MAAITTWGEAREAARGIRAALLGLEEAAGRETTAEPLLTAALRAAGLRCYPRRPSDPLLSGAHAVLDPEAHAVWVRADSPAADRRVYVAHELAHFHLHEHGELCHCAEPDFAEPDAALAVGYGPRQRRETEANVFAREFLLPVAVARRLFESGTDARAIAARLGLPISLVFAQLTEGLTLTLPSPPAPLPQRERGAGGEGSAFPLDASQETAARVERGPLLVGAGPGTGKTRTLTARVLYLTREQGLPPENLLALTFSRKAVEEMRERISALDPEVARLAAISTFHAYGLDLLRRHGRVIGLPPNPVLLDQADAIALLERRAASLGLTALRYLHDPAFPLPDVLRTIGRAKEDMLTPEDFAVRADATGDERLAEVARIYTAYEELLREKGAVDYSDLVCRALRLLEENEVVLAAERAQWRHILVDEYQDVNRGGARLVQLLAGEGAGLWAVGDLRQAIYRFRGASPANVARFHHDFPNGRRADLAVNYRSQPSLVALFGVASGEGPGVWEAARPQTSATIALAVADDDQAQADGIAARMREYAAQGYHYSDQVVLCRTRSQARALRAGLSARGIPIAAGADEGGLLSRRDVKEMIGLLSRAAEPGGPARRRYPDLPEGLPYKGDALDFWTELLWGRPGWARQITDAVAVGRLLAVARAFRERAEAILEESDEPRRAFLRHLRRMARLGVSFGDPDAGDSVDAIRVLTVHAAKGLEFPVVFLPNLSAGKFPSRPGPSLLPPLPEDADAPAENDAAEEEARLFFVALTRAKDHLILSRALRYGKWHEMPSPLLRKIDRAPGLMHEVWVAAPPSPPAPAPQAGTGEEVEGLGGEGGATPAEEAELYLRCPRRYYYERVAEVPAGERAPYNAFRRSVEEALARPDPVAGLEAAWVEHGLEPNHPYTPLYKQAAGEIVARAKPKGAMESVGMPVRRRMVEKEPLPTLTLDLENGAITVQPDAADPSGTVLECHTFRKPPVGEEPIVPNEPRFSLLLEAARRAHPKEPVTVNLHYLQSGQTFPVPEKPKVRARHLADYDRALKGIRLQVFNPTPADVSDCSACPFFFICPD